MVSIELKKKRLFRKSKPVVRPISPDDMWVFWAAYKEGSFPELAQDLDRSAFDVWLKTRFSKHSAILVVEDANAKFKDKRGIVCFITLDSTGVRIEPQFYFLKWATKINMLRSTVRFFNWVRYNRAVGVCVVRCIKESLNLFHHTKDYGVLYYVGKIVGGDSLGRGDEYVFSIRGKLPERPDGAGIA